MTSQYPLIGQKRKVTTDEGMCSKILVALFVGEDKWELDKCPFGGDRQITWGIFTSGNI